MSAPRTPNRAPAAALDWGIGHYEHTAAQLFPAAQALVERAAPAPGQRLLDVGCGTGNAALLAAERGCEVVGVDPAPRLLEVARQAARERGLDATFLAGSIESLPLSQDSADLVLSAFGLIFATDPEIAAAELDRVTAGGGRILITAWLPRGAIFEAIGEARRTVARALDAPPAQHPFAWHEPAALAGLLGPHGFDLEATEERIAFTGSSAAAFLDAELANHPMAVGARALLEPRGELKPLRERMLAIYEAANEDVGAFRVTSRYVLAVAQRR